MHATAALLLLAMSLTGCVRLYAHTIVPATNDFHATPVMRESPARLNVKRINYPRYIDVRWDSNAIGDIAKEHGFSRVYYADVEELQILLGIWRQTWLIVYGERTEDEAGDSAPPSSGS